MYSKEKQLLALMFNCKVDDLKKRMNLSDEELDYFVSKLNCLKENNRKSGTADIGRQSLRLDKLLNSLIY